ncbi:MAG TPA: signal peptidase I [Alphaproteobacteria bacterium]
MTIPVTKPAKDIQPAKNPNHLFETIKTIFIAALFAMTIRSVAFEPFSIPSGSMVPTLLVGDYLFVAKYAYGYSKYSFPMGVFPIQERLKPKQPDRGDVIVFRKPTDVRIDFIKRLVGLPGDKIQVRKGRLYINDKMVERKFIGNYESRLADGSIAMHRRYWETLPGGKKHLIIERGDNGPLDNTPAYNVPEGHYFMMGDNRDGSQDSRVLSDVGYVPYENLIGRATYLFFSVDEDAAAWEFWRWPWTVRFTRIFNHIN